MHETHPMLKNRPFKRIFLYPYLSTAAILFSTGILQAHIVPSGGGGATGTVNGTGRAIFQTSRMNTNDTAKISIDLFCHLGHAYTGQLRDGDPLGTGGKISGTYNAFLYGVSPGGSPSPTRADPKVQYGDFGYIPLWQPNNLSGRIGYRFLPTLLGRISLAYTLDKNGTGSGTAGSQINLGELLFKWTPRRFEGLGISLGRLLWTGAYADIFDQMPLEQFSFDGAVFSYSADPTETVSVSGKIGIGSEFAGQSASFSDTTGYPDVYYQYTGEIWRRLHCIGSFTTTVNNNFSVKVLGGYQRVPRLETEVKIGSVSDVKMKDTLPESQGWHAGLQLSGTVLKSQHTVTLAYGNGDVQLGWSAPSFIDRKRQHHLPEIYLYGEFGRHAFSRKGCSVLHGSWWMDLRRGRLKGATGVWASYDIPAEIETMYIFEGTDRLNNYTIFYDTVSVDNRNNTRSVNAKGAMDFSYRIAGPFHIGLRGDIIHYNNPDAVSNVLEFERFVNEFRYVKGPPAKWEYEAVNCRIVTPYFLFNVANMLYIKGAYAFAFYDRMVVRQGNSASKHGNFILSTQLNWRFAKLNKR